MVDEKNYTFDLPVIDSKEVTKRMEWEACFICSVTLFMLSLSFCFFAFGIYLIVGVF